MSPAFFVAVSFGQGLAYTALTAASLTGIARDRYGIAGAFNVTAARRAAVRGGAGTARP